MENCIYSSSLDIFPLNVGTFRGMLLGRNGASYLIFEICVIFFFFNTEIIAL